MRIGEVARLAGASPKAIRRYEAMGLISPRRSANGYREYSEHDVRVVREIRTLGRLGIAVDAPDEYHRGVGAPVIPVRRGRERQTPALRGEGERLSSGPGVCPDGYRSGIRGAHVL
ncbi:MerR family DNA-binding transcriptional regulator [Nocardia sp. NPDC059239]|uniref:MerR family DNA-binding transcriptional regulator n=1 Tax=unclassified Nocardia TaxID=2637762 RepID=UPI0036BE0973